MRLPSLEYVKRDSEDAESKGCTDSEVADVCQCGILWASERNCFHAMERQEEQSDTKEREYCHGVTEVRGEYRLFYLLVMPANRYPTHLSYLQYEAGLVTYPC